MDEENHKKKLKTNEDELILNDSTAMISDRKQIG
jgi:hypothetical protein